MDTSVLLLVDASKINGWVASSLEPDQKLFAEA